LETQACEVQISDSRAKDEHVEKTLHRDRERDRQRQRDLHLPVLRFFIFQGTAESEVQCVRKKISPFLFSHPLHLRISRARFRDCFYCETGERKSGLQHNRYNTLLLFSAFLPPMTGFHLPTSYRLS
jgi:hypothetical protein